MEFLPSAPLIGPFLRFNNYDPESREFRASVLIVVNPSAKVEEPTLVYGPDGTEVTGRLLDTFHGFDFFRFDLAVELGGESQTIEYNPQVEGSEGPYSFTVPAASETWNWFFYSCNGFHEDSEAAEHGGIQPLWRDVNKNHREKPFHVQVGGGDQLYNDNVWKVQSLQSWLQIEKDVRSDTPPTEDQANDVATYYFNHYCQHFSEPEFKEALAGIPYIFTWDDHDIFDGWGSYPDYLHNCAMFRMVYGAAKRFYLLFQQHATEETAEELNNCWGAEGGFHEIKLFGSSVALWAMDNRTERNLSQIVAPGSYDLAKQRFLELPSGVRHVVLLCTVPLVFPEMPAGQNFFAGVQSGWGMFTVMNKTGLSQSLMNQFGEPDLLDDIIDHWSAKEHLEERTALVKLMQDVAYARQVRVTFISGDVHSAGVGRFYSYPKKNGEDFRKDFRFMANITSSSIGNTPMPAGLVAAYNKVNHAADIPDLLPTREKMVRRFRGGNDKVYGRRNYCAVKEFEYDPSNDDINNGALCMTLRAEHPTGKIDIWENFIPILTTVEDVWGGDVTEARKMRAAKLKEEQLSQGSRARLSKEGDDEDSSEEEGEDEYEESGSDSDDEKKGVSMKGLKKGLKKGFKGLKKLF